MRIDIITLFPEMCSSIMGESIVARARKKGCLQICFHQLRDFALDKHKKVDDTPFGGGKGMLLKAEPIALAIDSITEHVGQKPYVIYMSPKGSVFNQEKAVELSKKENITFICGHYEGIDERIIDTYVDEQISIGDFVLTGGEMPALVITDAVSRMIPGVLSEDVCFTEESHFSGLLEHPQYTKPSMWRGQKVPDVLLSGDHAKIEKWKNDMAISETKKFRQDMYNKIIEDKILKIE